MVCHMAPHISQFHPSTTYFAWFGVLTSLSFFLRSSVWTCTRVLSCWTAELQAKIRHHAPWEAPLSIFVASSLLLCRVSRSSSARRLSSRPPPKLMDGSIVQPLYWSAKPILTLHVRILTVEQLQWMFSVSSGHPVYLHSPSLLVTIKRPPPPWSPGKIVKLIAQMIVLSFGSNYILIHNT